MLAEAPLANPRPDDTLTHKAMSWCATGLYSYKSLALAALTAALIPVETPEGTGNWSIAAEHPAGFGILGIWACPEPSHPYSNEINKSLDAYDRWIRDNDVVMAGDFNVTYDAAWDSAPPGTTSGTIGEGIEALWCDTYLHADDIRHALGMPSVRGQGEAAYLSHIAQLLTEQGWGPADLRFGDLGTYPVSGGGGKQIEGDALQFILVATGRSDPSTFGLDETVNIYRA